MTVIERLAALRKRMQEDQIDVYLVPSSDYHQSEWVGEYFKSLEYISGFTGTAGTLLITQTEGELWTDGRFWIQAEQELNGTDIQLMKEGEKGVPSVEERLEKLLPEKGCLAFDGRVITLEEGEEYERIAACKNAGIKYEQDYIGEIWENRPSLPGSKVFVLGTEYTGETVESKLNRVRGVMCEHGATKHLLAKLEDICWLFDIRESDPGYFPLVPSYAVISLDGADLYIDEKKINEEASEELNKNNVQICPYHRVYEDIKKLSAEEKIMLDQTAVNYALVKNIPLSVDKIMVQNPETYFRAIKNLVEIENMRKAGLKDSVAHTKFMKWIKENVGRIPITELSASKKLEELRKEQENFLMTYVDPISATGWHGAVIHYVPTAEKEIPLEKGTFYLHDSGTGYKEGSTDITRTYALGEVSQEMKDHFTLVLIGNLRLANAHFLHGTTGVNLDILARMAMWEKDLDYKHGTGHGIGYLLNVHEGPGSIGKNANKLNHYMLEEGMILSDEPGIYIEGSHGIRLENDLLVRRGNENDYGQFLYFEILDYVPMDLDAVNPMLMTDKDKALLNDYHKKVYEKIAPYFNEAEKEWLKKYTRPI